MKRPIVAKTYIILQVNSGSANASTYRARKLSIDKPMAYMFLSFVILNRYCSSELHTSVAEGGGKPALWRLLNVMGGGGGGQNGGYFSTSLKRKRIKN